MDKQYFESKASIFYSCLIDKLYIGEHFLPEHMLMKIYSGELEIKYFNRCKVLSAGDTVLVARNQLSQITKKPKDGAPFKSLTLFLPQQELRDYFAATKAEPHHRLMELQLNRHPLIDSLFESILKYYEIGEELPAELTELKIKEAVAVLKNVQPESLNILTDFSEPGKIDLENFMMKNYQFNVSLDRFAYLTGRSLATFKRDFKRIFLEPPSRWLQQKRLQTAYDLMVNKQLKASDVYLEVGFENLSHFSYAFKNQFGFPPSAI
jgi:AraC-like DNA-binding protein